MRWFRTNRQIGARLALIAVVLQLVLTFGHVHVPSAALSSAVLISQSNGTAPQGPDHNGRPGSDCPTCALIQLSAISAPSVAPQLPLPWAIDFVTVQPYTELAPATALRASFQARAPPAA
jgi:hypothetical protein